ncbi:MAG: hypothetical protein KGI71_04070 [Patescibacteria group bacterium]|nr:hypothetical protein [Patescibacteria group bacterium]
MTEAQFAALAHLLSLRTGAAQEAARLVLVHGHRPTDAAAATGLSVASVSNAVARVRRGLELARSACGQS